MKIDLVHDIQGVYRKVLNSMARPGVIESLAAYTNKVDINIQCYKGTVLVMLMLLDGEVSFNVVSKNAMEVTSIISQITYAKVKPLEEADYIFILNDSINVIGTVFENGKEGTLIDPNLSSTIIAEVNSLSVDKVIELCGPGIEEKNYVNVQGCNQWIEARNRKNKEYPLGIDSIFVDEKGKLISIPRTTKVNLLEA